MHVRDLFILISGRIVPSERMKYLELTATQRYAIVTWTFDITIHNHIDDGSGAQMYLYLHNHEQYHTYLSHYRTSRACVNNTPSYLTYDIRDPRLTHLTTHVEPSSQCLPNAEQNSLRCHGEIRVASAYPVYYVASLAFFCRPGNPYLDVEYDITLQPYENVTCLETRTLGEEGNLASNVVPYMNELKTFYTHYSQWNLFGLTPEDIRTQSSYLALLEAHTCYKYLLEMLFRLALPQCVNGHVIYQCSEMCDDFRRACDPWQLSEYVLGCANLASKASPHACYFQQVTCDNPVQAPANGTVVVFNTTVDSIIEFECNPGFELIGDSTAVCEQSGDWSMVELPTCHPISDKRTSATSSRAIIITVSTIASFFLVILLLSLLLYGRYRHEVFILIFRYFRCLLCCERFKNSEESKLYDAFVAYHDDDEAMARTLLETLEGSNYRLFVDFRDGRLGERMIRYVPEVIAQSQRVILLLSQQFLEDRMCEYMLDQAFYQTLEGESFKVIIILMEDIKTMQKIPRFMKGFLRTSLAIQKGDNLFYTKLKHAMPQPQSSVVDEDLSSAKNGETAQEKSDSIADSSDTTSQTSEHITKAYEFVTEMTDSGLGSYEHLARIFDLESTVADDVRKDQSHVVRSASQIELEIGDLGVG